MSSVAQVALGDLVVRERAIRPTVQDHWSLNLDQIESHSGRVLSWERVMDADVASSTFFFDEGTVLYSKLRPYLNKVVVSDRAGVATTELVPLRVDSNRVSPAYLAYFLRSPKFLQFATTAVAGAKMPRMVMTEFWKYEIPLPPLHEQRRIATILDKADALRAQRRQAIAKLDELVRAVFLEMFGDPVTNPKGWPMSTLGEVADFYAGSSLPESIEFVGQPDGFLSLKVSDMNRLGNEEHIVTASLWRADRARGAVLCPANAIIIPKRGGAIGTNKKRVLTRAAHLDPNLMGIHAKKVDTRYLFAWFERFDLGSISSGSSVPQLNKRDLAPLTIPVPLNSVQREFKRVSDEINRKGAKFTQSAAHLDALAEALKGQFFV